MGLLMELTYMMTQDNHVLVEGRTIIKELLKGKTSYIEIRLQVALIGEDPNRSEELEALPPNAYFLPSRHLLDKPDGNYSEDGRLAIYIGTCEDLECHGIQIEISLERDRVIWSGFVDYRTGQHTPIHDSPNFIFGRKQYEKALERPPYNEQEKQKLEESIKEAL